MARTQSLSARARTPVVFVVNLVSGPHKATITNSFMAAEEWSCTGKSALHVRAKCGGIYKRSRGTPERARPKIKKLKKRERRLLRGARTLFCGGDILGCDGV